ARGTALPARRPPHREAGHPGAALARDARRPREVMMAVRFVPTPTAVIPAHSAAKTRVNALMLGIHIPELVVMVPALAGTTVHVHLDIRRSHEKIVRSRDLAGQARVFTRGHCRRRGPHHLHRRTYRANG